MTTRKINFRSGISRAVLTVLAIITLTCISNVAHAACYDRGQGTAPALAKGLIARLSGSSTVAHDSIAGLWDATYTTSDHQPFQESYDMWHMDGTELESANVNPLIGNLCLGVWDQVGKDVHLHHVGWGFDNIGNLIGPFTVDDVLTLGNRGNSYSGSFDFKQYDNDGNLLQEVTGTIAATRISVD